MLSRTHSVGTCFVVCESDNAWRVAEWHRMVTAPAEELLFQFDLDENPLEMPIDTSGTLE